MPATHRCTPTPSYADAHRTHHTHRATQIYGSQTRPLRACSGSPRPWGSSWQNAKLAARRLTSSRSRVGRCCGRGQCDGRGKGRCLRITTECCKDGHVLVVTWSEPGLLLCGGCLWLQWLPRHSLYAPWHTSLRPRASPRALLHARRTPRVN